MSRARTVLAIGVGAGLAAAAFNPEAIRDFADNYIEFNSDTEGGEAEASASPLPLEGKTIVIDPGHNVGNFDPANEAGITTQVDNGNGGTKDCNSTGTALPESQGEYLEAQFNLAMSQQVGNLLTQQGATVIYTYEEATAPPYGPCVDARAATTNQANPDLAVSIHADGAVDEAQASRGSGFHILLSSINPNLDISRQAAAAMSASLREGGAHCATYLETDENCVVTTDELAGPNLMDADIPAILLENGNMHDPADIAQLFDPTGNPNGQTARAMAIVRGITNYLAPSTPVPSPTASPIG